MELKRTFHYRCLRLLTCFVMVCSSLPTFVLCIGADSHIAIKSLNSDCCNKSCAGVSGGSSIVSVEEEFSSNKNNCGACVDIPLSIKLPSVLKKPNPVNTIFQASSTTVIVAVSSPDFSEYQSTSELLAVLHPCLTVLHSIILLI